MKIKNIITMLMALFLVGAILSVIGCGTIVKPELISLDPPDALMEPPQELQLIKDEHEEPTT